MNVFSKKYKIKKTRNQRKTTKANKRRNIKKSIKSNKYETHQELFQGDRDDNSTIVLSQVPGGRMDEFFFWET